MIPVAQPSLGALERAYLLDAFDSGWVSSRGEYIERAEVALKALTGAKHVAATSNGTTALHLALLAAGIGPGDEVIVPSLTYIATLNAVLYTGATPVVVDVDDHTWCIDPAAVASSLTEATAAVLAVDLFGHPAPYEALRRVVSGTRAVVIADAAESFGGAQGGRAVGSLAELTTFSFFGNKVVTCGEGGAVASDDPEAHNRVLTLRNQGNSPTAHYHHERLGYNYRLTNLSAAVLLAQLERAGELLDRRRHVVARYTSLLAELPEIRMQALADGAVAAPWMVTVRISGADASRRDRVIEFMARAGVETRPMFRPVQAMPYVSLDRPATTPVTSLLSREGISLPTFPGLTDDEVETVVGTLSDALDATRAD